MSTAERYTVSDSVCGFVGTFGKRLEAVDGARRHWRRHLDDGTRTVDVFDRLARYGAVNLWKVDAHGKCCEAGRKESAL